MVQFKLNGQAVQTTAPNNTPLLNVLSNDLKINGTKFGCGKAQCNACLVMVDGNPMKSCVAPVASVAGRSVTTLSGMKEGDKPSRLQQAFIDEQAAQCGYCLNGMVMMTVALLKQHPQPTETQIRQALSGNLCRCGTHVEIIAAVKRAAQLMQTAAA